MSANFTNFDFLTSSTPEGLVIQIKKLVEKKLMFEVVSFIYDTDKKQHVAYIKCERDRKKIKIGIL